jgi:hypothetical protein
VPGSGLFLRGGCLLSHVLRNWMMGLFAEDGPLKLELAKCVIDCSTRPYLWLDSGLQMPNINRKFMRVSFM